MMHAPTFKPACWVDTASARCDWAADRGRSCGNAYSTAGIEIMLRHTPSCHGCRRLIRAWEIIEGTITPDAPDPRGPGAVKTDDKAEIPAAGASKPVVGTSAPSESHDAHKRSLAPKAYLHELTETELAALVTSGMTWGELADRFTGPPWCASQASAVGPYGCWALTAFRSSRIRTRADCGKCSEFRGGE